MTLDLPDAILPLLATAGRQYALELRSATRLALTHLDSPFACVSDPERERARLAALLVESELLLEVSGLIQLKLDSK